MTANSKPDAEMNAAEILSPEFGVIVAARDAEAAANAAAKVAPLIGHSDPKMATYAAAAFGNAAAAAKAAADAAATMNAMRGQDSRLISEAIAGHLVAADYWARKAIQAARLAA